MNMSFKKIRDKNLPLGQIITASTQLDFSIALYEFGLCSSCFLVFFKGYLCFIS